MQPGTRRVPKERSYQSRILMAVCDAACARVNPVMKSELRLGSALRCIEPDAGRACSWSGCSHLVLILIAVVVRAFYKDISPHGRLSSMPYFLVLWMVSTTYIVWFQEAIRLPPTICWRLLCFTLCIYLCNRRSYFFFLIPVFAVQCSQPRDHRDDHSAGPDQLLLRSGQGCPPDPHIGGKR